jgi:lambda family phage holin
MPKMPDKPDTWMMVTAFVWQYMPTIYAATLSCVMAFVRIVYGGGTRRQAICEGTLSGGLTLTLISGLEYFGFPSSLAAFVGGWVGILGVKKIVGLAERYADSKLPKTDPQP